MKYNQMNTRNGNDGKKIKIGAVVGCTASGKTALSIELARRLGGEIISCDSMQIYKGMDIGTAKPTAEERALAPHHLIDFLSPEQSYSCADYVRDARAVVDDIVSRGRLPIFCGGTGLYLDRFLRGGTDEDAECDPEYRKYLLSLAETEGVDRLHDMLASLDPESAEAIHKNNVKRVARALEIIHATGRKKSEIDRENSAFSDEYDICVIYPYYNDRSILYSRIDARVDKMLEEGLVEETERLYSEGVFDVCATAAQAIGYKELLPYIKGEQSFEACVDTLKGATRRYAKRQCTWFNSKEYAQKVDMDGDGVIKRFEEIVNISEKVFRNRLFCDIMR